MRTHPVCSTISVCFVLTGVASALPQKPIPKQINLKTYRNSNRLWIVFAPSPEDKRALLQQKLLFALVVAEQNSKVPGADRFPPLEVIGKSFFISTGLRLIDERKMPPEQLQSFYMAQIAVIRSDHAKAADPAGARDAEVAGCLKMAESVPPPPPA